MFTPAELPGKIRSLMARHGVPGASVAVVAGGRLEWSFGFGVATVGGSAPVDPDTPFQVASLSKPVSAAAALALVDAHRLSLDEDINTWLSTWKVPQSPGSARQPVTVRRILSHTAGFTLHGVGGYVHGEAVPTLLQILKGEAPARNVPIRLFFQPGAGSRYSGGGYAVLQQLICDITGTPYHDAAAALVLDGLEMRHSTFEQPPPKAFSARAASGHEGGLPLSGGALVYPAAAAAGLWSSASDLVGFLLAVQRMAAGQPGGLPKSFGDMLVPQPHPHYGLGFALRGPPMRPAVFEHTGAHRGFEAYLSGRIEGGQGAVVLANANTSMKFCAAVMLLVSRAYGWSGAPKPSSDSGTD